MAKKGPSTLGIVVLLLVALSAPWRNNCVFASRLELHPGNNGTIDEWRRKLLHDPLPSCSSRAPQGHVGQGGGGRGGDRRRSPPKP